MKNGHVEPSAVPTVAEQEADALLKQLGDDLEIDGASADLSMPDAYGLQVWANRRVAAVRDANLLKLQAQANKRLNERVAEQAMQQYNALCWEIAVIDKRYPRAKALSQELMMREAERAKAV